MRASPTGAEGRLGAQGVSQQPPALVLLATTLRGRTPGFTISDCPGPWHHPTVGPPASPRCRYLVPTMVRAIWFAHTDVSRKPP